MQYNQIVQYLESLTVMPKTMPGLEKIRSAVARKNWFSKIEPRQVITIAGTNGKGTTAAGLEALLLSEGKKVGLYTSPHLVSTTERIRLNGCDISEAAFTKLFLENKVIIEEVGLSHFESLTLMAADYFFTQELDYIVFEVGLGGSYDATNIFPNHYAVITKIGLDHENILGHNLVDIARNKFGIIKKNAVVVHHALDPVLDGLVSEVQAKTKSRWIETEKNETSYSPENLEWGSASFVTNLIGPRAIENLSTAITLFKELGFDFEKNKHALKNIRWPGRMQKIAWPDSNCPVYLSGDHNPQGIDSLIEILKYYHYENLHLIVGIGADKACDIILKKLLSIPRAKLYLTETPFKGRKLLDYPVFARNEAILMNPQAIHLLDVLDTNVSDLVVVTGSLYLIGNILAGLDSIKLRHGK